jgi:large subunit ribosomal protein L4
MTVQKFITYNPIDITGKKLDLNYQLTLNVSETSGNYLLHRDLLRHFNSQKQNTASTKTRSEVRGGGRKPWRQKGTGRARAGSNRSPLWKGGGVIFGPKPKKITVKSNKKERQLALQTLLYNKKNSILVIENLETAVVEPKTKVLVVVSKKTIPLKLSTQNIQNVELISVNNLNTFSLLKAKQIIFTESAINYIKESYCD